MPTQHPPAVVEFLQRPLIAHLATLNPSGSPQLSVMWFKYEDGEFLFTTTTGRVKYRNYERDPRAAMTVIDPDDMYKWVIVNGRLSVDHRDPIAFYRGLSDHYLGPEQAAESWKTAALEGRTVLRLTQQRIRTRGFPTE